MLQLPLWTPESDWTPPDHLPDIRGRGPISLDTENRDPAINDTGPGWATRNGHVAGVSVAVAGWKNYLPIGHEGGGNMDPEKVISWLQTMLSGTEPKLFFNAGYDLGWLSTIGVSINGSIRCCQAAAALLDENRYSYSLDDIALERIGRTKDETLLREAALAYGAKSTTQVKGMLWRLHSKFVGPYATEDADLPLCMWPGLQQDLANENLSDLFDLEMDIIEIVTEMKQIGIPVDLDRAEQLSREYKKRASEALAGIQRLISFPFKPGVRDHMLAAFRELGLEHGTTKAGNASFSAENIAHLDHPFVHGYLRYQKLNKLDRDYIQGIVLDGHYRGRIHCEFNTLKSDQGGTVSGRLSISGYPMHQIPGAKSKELGDEIRSLFPAEHGCEWICADYNQQEPRLTVHYADLLGCRGVKDVVQSYWDNPWIDYHQVIADLTGLPRAIAKNLNLGLAYGLGIAEYARKYGIPLDIAEQHYEQYHANNPFIKDLTGECSNAAQKRGFIKTILKRRGRFPLWEPARRGKSKVSALPREAALAAWPNEGLRRAFTHKAMNKLIQGSAADQIKKAMRDLRREGILACLQMHDELDFANGNPRMADTVEEIMRETVRLRVPVVVDIEVGPSWGELEKL